MNATYKQALENKKNLTIRAAGNGYWHIGCVHRGKNISAITTDSLAIEDFSCENNGEKRDGKDRKLIGYVSLCEKIIRDNLYK
jgi:hypothetical protein